MVYRLKDSPVTPVNSEATVIGAMLLDRPTVEKVASILPDGSYFYRPEHRVLYDEILAWAPQAPADGWDVVAFRNRLQSRGRYEAVGGIELILQIIESTVGPVTAVYHAKAVYRGWTARQAVTTARTLATQLCGGADVGDQLQAVCVQLQTLAAACTPSGAALPVVTADRIEAETLEWFWPNRIPAGMYSFIVGDPGAGKSFLSCYIAAIASNGGFWADGSGACEPMDVLMCVSEDHLARTMVPRLNAHCADMSRVHFYHAAATEQTLDVQRDMQKIERFLDATPACGLILLDPVTGFMGSVNQNSQAEVRQSLGHLCRLAEQRNITIIGLSHLNKKVDLDMRHRSIGSVAFNAVPRAVWGVYAMDDGGMDDCQSIGDVADEVLNGLNPINNRPSSFVHRQSTAATRRLLFPIKDNLCIEPQALEFTIDDGILRFGESLTPGQLKNALHPDKQQPTRLTKKEHAKQLILETLKNGPLESNRLIQTIKAHHISEHTLRIARKELRDAGKIDCESPDNKGWRWFLQEHR